jgi:hypothetical protein
VVLAGYAPCPAEEIEGETGATTVQTPRRKSEISANGSAISTPQQKRLFAIAKEHGWSNDELRALLGQHGFEHSHDVTQSTYGKICGELEAR